MLTCCSGDLAPRHKVTRFRGTFTHHEIVLSVRWIVASVSTVHSCVSRRTFCNIEYKYGDYIYKLFVNKHRDLYNYYTSHVIILDISNL